VVWPLAKSGRLLAPPEREREEKRKKKLMIQAKTGIFCLSYPLLG
jgi:hypothetical protein